MPHKKLFYVPGLISLLGLPVLLLVMSPEDPAERPNVLRMKLPSDKRPSDSVPFSKYEGYDLIKTKKLIQVSMYNENDLNRIAAKLDFARRELERLEFTNDTTSVLKVELGDYNSFGDFVWLQNQALILDIKRYAFMDNAYFFFPNPPPVHYRREDLEMTVDSIDTSLYHFRPPPSAWDIFVRKMGYFVDDAFYRIKKNLLLVIGFVLLLFVPTITGIIRSKGLAQNFK